MMILITGGSGSGKSAFAENISIKMKKKPFYYIATMKISDEECQQRVNRHREQRKEKEFITLEIPCNLEKSVENLEYGGTALVECVGNLTANEQFDTQSEDTVKTVSDGILSLRNHFENIIIVTNDIFCDIPPEDFETRKYLNNIGKINCILAENCDIVAEVCAGNVIVWKGEEKYDKIFV